MGEATATFYGPYEPCERQATRILEATRGDILAARQRAQELMRNVPYRSESWLFWSIVYFELRIHHRGHGFLDKMPELR